MTKVRVTQAAATLAFLPTNVGRAKGFFTEEALEVEQVSTGGGGPDLQALIAGEAQFNQGAGTYQADALRQGRKVMNVFNYLNKNVVNSAIHVDAAREKGITETSSLQEKLAGIKGLKLGGTRPGALTFQQAEYVVRLAGFSPQNEVQVVGAGEGPALIAALENRQVDIIFQTIPVPEQAIARGRAIMFINNAAGEDPSLVPFNMENVYTTPDLVEKEPDLVQRFVRAIKKSNDFIVQSSPEQIADAIKDDEFFKNTEREVLIAGITNIKAATNPTGILDKQAVENTLKMQQQTVNPDDVYALFTDRFVRAAP
jgi:NitT/TauT family transport system substrate-binding protein